MLEIVSVVEQLAPGLVQRDNASVACVCTTRPKYLVFNRKSKQPACVVEFGPAERLVRVDGILSELHPRFPSGVARPIVCTSWHNGTYRADPGGARRHAVVPPVGRPVVLE